MTNANEPGCSSRARVSCCCSRAPGACDRGDQGKAPPKETAPSAATRPRRQPRHRRAASPEPRRHPRPARRQGAARRRGEDGERPRLEGAEARHGQGEADRRRQRRGPLHGLDDRRQDVRQLGQARRSRRSFPLGNVIKGWTEGLQLMVVGEKRRFWIPANLAYGDTAGGGRPSGMLVFDVELLGITPAPAPRGPGGRRGRRPRAPRRRSPASPTTCSRKAPARSTRRPTATSRCTTRAGRPTARCSTAR